MQDGSSLSFAPSLVEEKGSAVVTYFGENGDGSSNPGAYVGST